MPLVQSADAFVKDRPGMISVGAELCGSLIFRMRSLHRPVVDYSALKVKFAFFHQAVFLLLLLVMVVVVVVLVMVVVVVVVVVVCVCVCVCVCVSACMCVVCV